MFLGTHPPRPDDTNRLALPAGFRQPPGDGLVITRGHGRCPCVWPPDGFKATTEQLSAAPLTSKAARGYPPVLFAGAHDEVPGRQGRVTVPQPPRHYAGLVGDLAVIGANTRAEIWSADAREGCPAAQEDIFPALSQEVPPGLM